MKVRQKSPPFAQRDPFGARKGSEQSDLASCVEFYFFMHGWNPIIRSLFATARNKKPRINEFNAGFFREHNETDESIFLKRHTDYNIELLRIRIQNYRPAERNGECIGDGDLFAGW